MLVDIISAIVVQAIRAAPPASVPVVDPRSTVELLIQAFAAVVMLVGITVLTRQLIYKQFGRENYATAEFRKGMLRGVLWLLLGLAIMTAAIVLSPRLR